MAGLFGPTVAEIQQSINERGKAEDLQRASLPRGRGPVLAGASFGRNLGQMLFGQPNNPDLQKARGLQEVEQSVRQTVAENNIQDPSLVLEISKKMLLERGFIQEALMVHQKSVEANKAQLEQRRAEADASRAEVGARVAAGTEQSQIEAGNLAPDIAQQQLDTSEEQERSSVASRRLTNETIKLRRAQTEKAQKEIENLSTANQGFASLLETLQGAPEKVKMLAILNAAKGDPQVAALFGGDAGIRVIEAMSNQMLHRESTGDMEARLLREKFNTEDNMTPEQWAAKNPEKNELISVLSGEPALVQLLKAVFDPANTGGVEVIKFGKE